MDDRGKDLVAEVAEGARGGDPRRRSGGVIVEVPCGVERRRDEGAADHEEDGKFEGHRMLLLGFGGTDGRLGENSSLEANDSRAPPCPVP